MVQTTQYFSHYEEEQFHKSIEENIGKGYELLNAVSGNEGVTTIWSIPEPIPIESKKRITMHKATTTEIQEVFESLIDKRRHPKSMMFSGFVEAWDKATEWQQQQFDKLL